MKKTVTLNLLGEPGYHGPVYYEGFKECMSIEGVKIHLYGKKETRPFRKMGHVTILSDSLEHAMNKAQASGDRSKMKAIQSEILAVTDAMTRCFDDLAKKYPEIDKSEKLQEELTAKADEKCPGPENVK